MEPKFISVRGVREHNLKNIDIDIPRNQFIVITGISGSGKSSLAFDTLYAEGQRRYIESLSAYARQFLEQMKKPDVDHITGLPPAIAIEQRKSSSNPRSTVATTTEIYDYLRLLFARIGIPHCPECGRVIARQSSTEIIDRIAPHPGPLPQGAREREKGPLPQGERTKVRGKGKMMNLLAPVVRGRKGEYKSVLDQIKKSGFLRVRVDGRYRDVDEEIKLEKYKSHNIDVLIDTFDPSEETRERLAEGVEMALKIGKGLLIVEKNGKDTLYSEKYACPECNRGLEELTPRMFSFNSPYGACPECKGLGFLMKIDPDLVIPDKKKTFREGAIRPWQEAGGRGLFFYYRGLLRDVLRELGRSLDDSPDDLKKEELDVVLYGSDDYGFEGVIPNLERLFYQTESQHRKEEILKYIREVRCPLCNGARLKKESLSVKIAGKSIMDITAMSIKEAKKFFETLVLDEKEKVIAKQILKEINSRLVFMEEVGLDYLTLDRMTHTLSGGEAERTKLATQIGSGLVGVLYILDEPTIGLHQRDNLKLISTLKQLRDTGNTVVVVEHDEETIRSADYVIDLGPGAGKHGGRVVACGPPESIIEVHNSLTGMYLSGKKRIPVPEKRREGNGRYIHILKARHNNLKDISVKLPLGVFVCVTGVSGSGKSSLVEDVLYKGIKKILYGSKEEPGEHDAILGIEEINKAIVIDQSPIGRTPRSNPATYTNGFTYIRQLFANTEEARIRGYKQGRFSFNVKGGRCEACMGEGITKIEMHFLPDVFVPCEVCKGKRYNRETLEVLYKGKNIADVLEMKIEDALDFFEKVLPLKEKLQTLYDVGLGYIELGQPATTLSGGEAQRVKLATELSKKGNERTLYILDEPTVGLHTADIEKLLGVLNNLVERGSTVLVIEHNLDVIKCADYIIDLGPEGGDKGGYVVAEGTPEQIAKNKRSYTGMFLKKVLGVMS
ncbi:MAG: excinuclease ABC subunit UvrA [Candidatus Ratteibacteria bacterium]|nr:excinuclease ABC subunit UvrA [Candidatus Ratteibacteria bacterium]